HLDFIHVDTGPRRTWQDKALKRSLQKRKLIGVLKDKGVVKLSSDQNEYLSGENPQFTWEFPHSFPFKKIQGLRLQKFWRGQWTDCAQSLSSQETLQRNFSLPTSDLKCSQAKSASPYGKYRWVFKIESHSSLHSSNEFY